MSDKKKKILKIIIPLIAVYLVLMGGIIFLIVKVNGKGDRGNDSGRTQVAVNEGRSGNADNDDTDKNNTSLEDDGNGQGSLNPDGNNQDSDTDKVDSDAEGSNQNAGNSDTDNEELVNADSDKSDYGNLDSGNHESGNATSNPSNENNYISSGLSEARLEYISKLSLEGDGYEGKKGTGNYNYGEALQKSILFYELQRSGKLPDNTRTNWRGDSCLNDGADNGLDLTGGWFDAGDNVKFNLPMAYTAAMLGWSLYEDLDAYEESGQLSYALDNIRYVCDYFIKCHPEDEVYYYQVGDGGADHSFWGPAEVVETRMNRPSYKVTKSSPGSCVVGETAAALSAASIVFEKEDPEYSKLLLEHAESLYKFADDTKSDSGYTAANGFYSSWSGFYDELSWAGAWLYKATGKKDYLNKAETYYKSASCDPKWAQCWDDVSVGAAMLLADITGDSTYTDFIGQHLDYWTTGNNGQKINYSPKGLAWLDNWGSLRYATTTGFIAAVFSESDNCPKDKKDTYWNFAVSQADYALGSSGRSYVCGFGDNPPVHPHHRTSQGSYLNNINEPSESRHILVGALVGGPDASDNYSDVITDYNKNEVACDYNAGYTGLMAKLYTKYHGQTIKNLGAIDTPDKEFFSEASINVPGDDYVEIKAYVYNESGWPARCAKDLELRYFVDLTEIYDAGGTVDDIQITTNYMQDAVANGLCAFDEDRYIYYMSISFSDGAVYPSGQESYRKEVQFRMRSTIGVWDDSNDFSYEGLSVNSMSLGTKLAVYEGGALVFGSEPEK